MGASEKLPEELKAELVVLAEEERMHEEDVLCALSTEPARAAEAMVTLFTATLFHTEQPALDDDAYPAEELAEYAREQEREMAKFWERCGDLVVMILNHPYAPRS